MELFFGAPSSYTPSLTVILGRVRLIDLKVGYFNPVSGSLFQPLHVASKKPCESCSFTHLPLLSCAGTEAAEDLPEDLQEGNLLRATAKAALLSAIPFGIASLGMLVRPFCTLFSSEA